MGEGYSRLARKGVVKMTKARKPKEEFTDVEKDTIMFLTRKGFKVKDIAAFLKRNEGTIKNFQSCYLHCKNYFKEEGEEE